MATLRAILSRYPEIDCAVLYGSRAKGTHRPGSDIDLTLMGEHVDGRTAGSVWSALDDSDLPYQLDVSAFSELRDEALKAHVRRVGVCLYVRDDMVQEGRIPTW